MESSSIFNCAIKVKNEPCDVLLAENYCKSIDKTPDTNNVQCSRFLLENTLRTNKLQKYEETYEDELDKMEIDFECKDVKPNVDSLIFNNRQNTIKVETAAVVKQEFCGDNATKLATKLDCELKKQNKKIMVPKKLNRKHELKKPIATMRGDITRTCDKCGKTFTSKYYLKIHIDSVHNGITHNCDLCGRKFSSKYYLKTHIDAVHNGVTYTCDICKKTFPYKASLQGHIDTVHNGNSPTCDICKKIFTRKYSLQLHIEECHNGITHTCDVCGKKLSTKGYLKTHMSTVHKKITHACDKCGKSFSTKSYLKVHINKTHIII